MKYHDTNEIYKTLKINFMKWFHLNNIHISNISNWLRIAFFFSKKTWIFNPSTDTERWSCVMTTEHYEYQDVLLRDRKPTLQLHPACVLGGYFQHPYFKYKGHTLFKMVSYWHFRKYKELCKFDNMCLCCII